MMNRAKIFSYCNIRDDLKTLKSILNSYQQILSQIAKGGMTSENKEIISRNFEVEQENEFNELELLKKKMLSSHTNANSS